MFEFYICHPKSLIIIGKCNSQSPLPHSCEIVSISLLYIKWCLLKLIFWLLYAELCSRTIKIFDLSEIQISFTSSSEKNYNLIYIVSDNILDKMKYNHLMCIILINHFLKGYVHVVSSFRLKWLFINSPNQN